MAVCGLLSTGEYFVVDGFSIYFIEEVMKNVSGISVIQFRFESFSLFVIPIRIKSDHRKTISRGPRNKAQTESFNKPLMKGIRFAHNG